MVQREINTEGQAGQVCADIFVNFASIAKQLEVFWKTFADNLL
jgi:hypothetical protein